MSGDGNETIQIRPSLALRVVAWSFVLMFAGMGFALLFVVGATLAGLIHEDLITLTLAAAFAVVCGWLVFMMGRGLRRSTTGGREGISGLDFQRKNATGQVQWWRGRRYSRDLVPWAEVASVRSVLKSGGEGSAWVAVVYLQDGTEAATAGASPFRKRTDAQVQALEALRTTSLDLTNEPLCR